MMDSDKAQAYQYHAETYWDSEYKQIDWRVVHNAGNRQKTIDLARREIDLFLAPTPEKLQSLYYDTENNPSPTMTIDMDKHPEYTGPRTLALDYGCGSLARYTTALAEHFDSVIGLDVSEEAINRAWDELWITDKLSKIVLGKCNGMTLDFPDDTFDFIFSNLVLQHIGYKEAIFNITREMGRCLKVGGMMRLEYLPSNHDKGVDFFHMVEGNGVSIDELKSELVKVGCELVCSTEQDPYLWITAIKK